MASTVPATQVSSRMGVPQPSFPAAIFSVSGMISSCPARDACRASRTIARAIIGNLGERLSRKCEAGAAPNETGAAGPLWAKARRARSARSYDLVIGLFYRFDNHNSFD